MFLKYISFVFFFGFAWAQTEFSLPENITLPPELEGKIDPDQLKNLQNQSLAVFKKKCEDNGGPNAFENAHAAREEFTNCLKGLVDVNVINEEIEKASPTGQVDEVFKKYCAKTPSFKGCFRNMTEAVKPCLSPKERDTLKTVYNITENLAEFVCNKEGDRIALFISEGGRECFEQQQELLQDCANSTLGTGFPGAENPSGWTPENIPNIAFGEEECKKLTALEQCVVGVLEKCPKPTTGNIVESLFKFIRKGTPCKDTVESRKSSPDSATGLVVTSATVLLGVVTAMLI